MQDRHGVPTAHSPTLRRIAEFFAPLLVMSLVMHLVQPPIGEWPGVGVGVAAGLAASALLRGVGVLVDRGEARRAERLARSSSPWNDDRA